MGLEAVKKEMAKENDDIDAIKSRMGAILDDFICDARSIAIYFPSFTGITSSPMSALPVVIARSPLSSVFCVCTSLYKLAYARAMGLDLAIHRGFLPITYQYKS